MTGSPETSCPGRQLTLVRPWGQRACRASQSDDEGLQVVACSCPPLPTVGPERRANHIDLMLGLSADQEVRIDIAAVEQVCPGQEISIGQVLLDGGAHDAILRGG